jgi:hypothetical protein
MLANLVACGYILLGYLTRNNVIHSWAAVQTSKFLSSIIEALAWNFCIETGELHEYLHQDIPLSGQICNSEPST